MDLLGGADRIVRGVLPFALEAEGMSRHAERLRQLPELRDAGTVTMACRAMRSARVLMRRAGPRDAVRLCEEAACAALAGDGRRTARYLREAAAAVLSSGPSPVLS